MRPPMPSGRSLALPRWRCQRAADQNAVAITYGTGVVTALAIFAVVCFTPNGLARRPLDFTAWVLVAFSALMYLAVGGGVTAFAVRRFAYWPGHPGAVVRGGNALIVLFWPITIAGLLLRAATAP